MNFDLEAAKIAQEIIEETSENKAKEVENLVTKTLGILQENGVYACMLYLFSRTSGAEKEISEVIRKKLFNKMELLDEKILTRKPSVDVNEADKVLKFLTDNICNNLNTLLLTKQLWEQTLIYARYGAKARS